MMRVVNGRPEADQISAFDDIPLFRFRFRLRTRLMLVVAPRSGGGHNVKLRS